MEESPITPLGSVPVSGGMPLLARSFEICLGWLVLSHPAIVARSRIKVTGTAIFNSFSILSWSTRIEPRA